MIKFTRIFVWLVLIFYGLGNSNARQMNEISIPYGRTMPADEKILFNKIIQKRHIRSESSTILSLELLAMQGYSKPQNLLAKIYRENINLRNDEKCLQWNKLSGLNGEPESARFMATAYVEGLLISPDLFEAYYWFKESEHDLSLRQIEFSQSWESKYWSIVDDLISIDDPSVNVLLKDLADNGSKEAFYRLALQELRKKPDSVEAEKAIAMLEKAASPGIANAQYELGKIKFKLAKNQTEKDKAEELYRLAAEKGHQDAQFSLAVRYTLGKDTDQDNEKALHYFKKAAKIGHKKAQHNLGVMYKHGIGTKKSEKASEQWFRKATIKNDLSLEKVIAKKDTVNNPNRKLDKRTKISKNTTANSKKNSISKSTSKKVTYLIGKNHFLSLKENEFVIQMLSGPNRNGVDDFIESNNFTDEKLILYSVKNSRSTNYQLQYGKYSDFQSALKDAKKFSNDFKDFKPWIRKVRDVRNNLGIRS